MLLPTGWYETSWYQIRDRVGMPLPTGLVPSSVFVEKKHKKGCFFVKKIHTNAWKIHLKMVFRRKKLPKKIALRATPVPRTNSTQLTQLTQLTAKKNNNETCNYNVNL